VFDLSCEDTSLAVDFVGSFNENAIRLLDIYCRRLVVLGEQSLQASLSLSPEFPIIQSALVSTAPIFLAHVMNPSGAFRTPNMLAFPIALIACQFLT
jgi:hypothetical protein